MKRILVLFLFIFMLFTLPACKVKNVIKTISQVASAAKNAKETEPIMKPPEGSPDWCGYKNADKWIKKYVGPAQSIPHYVKSLRGIVEFKGKSYGAADMKYWVADMSGETEGAEYDCGTIYFNEDGSDIWIHYEVYEGLGTEIHIVNGKQVERIEFDEYEDQYEGEG